MHGEHLLVTSHLAGVDVEVDRVAGLVAPGGRVQGGADVQLVADGLTDLGPQHLPGLGRGPVRAVLVLNGVENLPIKHEYPVL